MLNSRTCNSVFTEIIFKVTEIPDLDVVLDKLNYVLTDTPSSTVSSMLLMRWSSAVTCCLRDGV